MLACGKISVPLHTSGPQGMLGTTGVCVGEGGRSRGGPDQRKRRIALLTSCRPSLPPSSLQRCSTFRCPTWWLTSPNPTDQVKVRILTASLFVSEPLFLSPSLLLSFSLFPPLSLFLPPHLSLSPLHLSPSLFISPPRNLSKATTSQSFPGIFDVVLVFLSVHSIVYPTATLCTQQLQYPTCLSKGQTIITPRAHPP